MTGSDDLTGLLVPKPSPAVRYGQGTIVDWNPDTLSNVISWRGVQLVDVPVLAGVSALGYQPGDVVGMLGWDAGGEAGVESWWILGRLLEPGEQSPDVVIRGSSLLVQDADRNTRVSISLGPGGGQVATYHSNGEAHVLMGDISSAGESVGQGVVIQQADGRNLVNVFANPDTGLQQVRVFDHNQNFVFRTDEDGVGLERPYLDVPMYCPRSVIHSLGGGADTPWVLDVPNNPEGAGVDTWVTIWSGRMYATHPGISVQVRAVEISGQGSVRLVVNGEQVGLIAFPTSTLTTYPLGTPANLPGSVVIDGDNFYAVEIQARITSTTGRLMVVPYGVTKRGSV